MAKEQCCPLPISFFTIVLLMTMAVGISCAAGNPQVLGFKHGTSQKDLCDLFSGDWIFDPSLQPHYDATCEFIDERQNCIKNGRLDKAYLHWRWKPYGCDSLSIDSEKFLGFMENKTFGAIGDSVVRNQIESLMCLLSKVEKSVEVYRDKSSYSRTWHFPSHNFTLVFVWSPFLLKSYELKDHSEALIVLHLDILDDTWTTQYQTFDYVLLSTGSWFAKGTVMLENNAIVGCHSCRSTNVPELGIYYAYRRALDLAFGFITVSSHDDRKPELVVYKTLTPSHFEHGDWNSGGSCNRTLPFRKEDNFTDWLANYDVIQEYQVIEKEKFAKAAAAVYKNGIRLQLLDVYELSVLRPDGHPSLYRPCKPGWCLPDCLHWCLPGPIDTWNALLTEMLLRNDRLTSHSI